MPRGDGERESERNTPIRNRRTPQGEIQRRKERRKRHTGTKDQGCVRQSAWTVPCERRKRTSCVRQTRQETKEHTPERADRDTCTAQQQERDASRQCTRERKSEDTVKTKQQSHQTTNGSFTRDKHKTQRGRGDKKGGIRGQRGETGEKMNGGVRHQPLLLEEDATRLFGNIPGKARFPGQSRRAMTAVMGCCG